MPEQKPNIVVIMADDVPPYDLSCYHRGLVGYETPNIDRIAQQGLMVSDYYAQPSCTAGRAAFLTGQYPIRTGLTSVTEPGAPEGLHAEDPTLAELLKPLGYATAIFGRSHTGDRNEYLPTVHGFDEFFGFLYHLDTMEMPQHAAFPKDPHFPGRPRNIIRSWATNKDDSTEKPRWGRVGKQRIEDRGPLLPERMATIDNEFLEATTEWLDRTQADGQPFFLWFCPSRMHQQIDVSEEWDSRMHQQIDVSEEWRGKSGHGIYPDKMLHLDWLVGQLLDKLDQMGVTDNTIVLFTSDNGVNLSDWPMAGTVAFRGEKGATWDGGFRVPMLVRWPGHVPAGQWTGEFMTSEDWAPTLLAAAGVPDIKEKLLSGHTAVGKQFMVHLDGYNQLDLITGKGESKRHEFFFFAETELKAIRVDNWKAHLAVNEEWLEAVQKMPAMLIDLKADPFERTPDSERWLEWMNEKSWVLPFFTGPAKRFARSMEGFPPRQKGAAMGASAIPSRASGGGRLSD